MRWYIVRANAFDPMQREFIGKLDQPHKWVKHRADAQTFATKAEAKSVLQQEALGASVRKEEDL